MFCFVRFCCLPANSLVHVPAVLDFYCTRSSARYAFILLQELWIYCYCTTAPRFYTVYHHLHTAHVLSVPALLDVPISYTPVPHSPCMRTTCCLSALYPFVHVWIHYLLFTYSAFYTRRAYPCCWSPPFILLPCLEENYHAFVFILHYCAIFLFTGSPRTCHCCSPSFLFYVWFTPLLPSARFPFYLPFPPPPYCLPVLIFLCLLFYHIPAVCTLLTLPALLYTHTTTWVGDSLFSILPTRDCYTGLRLPHLWNFKPTLPFTHTTHCSVSYYTPLLPGGP